MSHETTRETENSVVTSPVVPLLSLDRVSGMDHTLSRGKGGGPSRLFDPPSTSAPQIWTPTGDLGPRDRCRGCRLSRPGPFPPGLSKKEPFGGWGDGDGPIVGLITHPSGRAHGLGLGVGGTVCVWGPLTVPLPGVDPLHSSRDRTHLPFLSGRGRGQEPLFEGRVPMVSRDMEGSLGSIYVPPFTRVCLSLDSLRTRSFP